MDRRQRLAIHRKRDQRVRLHRLLEPDAARERLPFGIAREVRVGAVVRGVDRRRSRPRRLEHVLQADTGPARAADPARGPGIAARRRHELGAAVAAAFEHQVVGDILEPVLELAEGHLERIVHLAIDRDLPGVRIGWRLGDLTVVADVVDVGRRHVVVEEMGRGLRDQGPVADHHQLG
jgi:hypothetical protein